MPMPLSASVLNGLSHRFSRKGQFDVSDAFAIAASCARRGDIFGREVWIDTAIEKIVGHGGTGPPTIYSSCLRDLAA
jgi:hypothetical protein